MMPNAVTDTVVLKALAGQGIDKDYVELWHDYAPRSLGKEYSPYAKIYRDLKYNKRFMVVSGLPMVDAYGNRNEVAWVKKSRIIENENNIFHAVVDKTVVRLIVLSDQPNGIKKNTECLYASQVFVAGSEIHPKSVKARILDTDFLNPNLHYNVAEWDYEIIKRRIRLLQGRYRDKHYVLSDPNGDVRIRHNRLSGDLKLKLGRVVDAKGESLECFVTDDEEVVPASEFKRPDIVYPIEIGASATFYPDADPETSSVDGHVTHYAPGGLSWANIVAAAGTASSDTSIAQNAMFWRDKNTANLWLYLGRGITLFDTSSLPDGASITSAVLSLYGFAKVDPYSDNPNVNVYSSAPASNTALVPGDFDSLGTTPFCDTPITYANWLVADPYWNEFTFNVAGLAAISKTGVTKLGLRNADHDVAEVAPSWVGDQSVTRLQAYTADQGTGYKPKLVIIYTAGQTYEESCSDGLKVGDSNKGSLTIGLALSDGLKGGDTSPTQVNLQNSLSDGLKGGDSPSTIAILNASAEDGAKLGDSLLVYKLLSLLTTDGFKLGDSLTHLYETNPSVIEGMLAGDSPSTIANLFNSLTDGAALGDTPTNISQMLTSLTDGLKAGDSASVKGILQVQVADGLILGDIIAVQYVLQALVTDGLKLSDLVLAIKIIRKLRLAPYAYHKRRTVE